MSRSDAIRILGVVKGKYMLEEKKAVKDIRIKSIAENMIIFKILVMGSKDYIDYEYETN